MKTILALTLLLPAAALAQAKPAPAPATPAPTRTQVVVTPTDQPELHRFMVAPKLGVFIPTSGMKSALYAGLEFGYLTPALDDRLAVVLEVDWARPRTSGNVTDPRIVSGDGAYNLGDAEVGVLLSAVYRVQDAAPSFTPYVGVGPGIFFHRTVTQAFQNTYKETEGRVGFQALVGADYAAGPGAAFLEVRYHFTKVDFLATGNANVGGFVIGAGYRFRF